jgi:hypothetical protein
MEAGTGCALWEHCMNHECTPMAPWTEAQLTTLLAVIDGPRRRLQILRPRPWYLAHPQRRLPRVQGVIRVRRWGLPKPCPPLLLDAVRFNSLRCKPFEHFGLICRAAWVKGQALEDGCLSQASDAGNGPLGAPLQ